MAQLDGYIRRKLKLRQLQVLVALDELRNVGRVAASLSITQPAVSKALGEIERGLGITLFERTARGVSPTVYGACLVHHARLALGNLNAARDELRDLVSGASGKIALGTLPAVAPTLVPTGLALLKQRSPGTRVLIREGTQEALVQELLQGGVDLVVGTLPGRGGHVEEKVLFEGRFVLVAGPRHALARRRRLVWSDLHGYPWALPPVGTLLREPLEAAFEEHGLPIPADHIETLSVNAICSYLKLSSAIGCLREEVAHHFQELGVIVALPLELPKLLGPVGMTWSPERPLSSSTRLMMQCLEHAAASLKRPARAHASS